MKIVERAHNEWPLLGNTEGVIEAVNRFQQTGVDHLVMDTFYGISELNGETVNSVLSTMERFPGR